MNGCWAHKNTVELRKRVKSLEDKVEELLSKEHRTEEEAKIKELILAALTSYISVSGGKRRR